MALLLVLAACEDSFTPIEPTELAFSVFGYLDASADTQWIRVMPIRATVPTEPGALDATVTLRRLDSDRTIVLRDSTFRFTGGPDVGSEGMFLHNFWTTEPIIPGASYQITAEWDNGGGRAGSTVDVPAEYVTEVWIAQPWSGEGDFLRLQGLTHVGIVYMTGFFYDSCGSAAQRLYFDPRSSPSGVHDIRIVGRIPGRNGCGTAFVERRELFVVGSGAEWPAGSAYDTDNLGVPDIPTNIENGIGFLAGVLTRTLPYELCTLERVEGVAGHCHLLYDDRTATLVGRVSDVLCGSGGVEEAAVVLRELVPSPTGRRTRPTSTNRSGDYFISGLDPEQIYELSIRRFVRTDPLEQYREQVDTLVFGPGEQRRYDVDLERLQCPA